MRATRSRRRIRTGWRRWPRCSACARRARALPGARARLRRRGQPRADGGRAARVELRRHRLRREAIAPRPGAVRARAREPDARDARSRTSRRRRAFDYVIAHGVYSWVPATARRLLAVSPGPGRARRRLRQLQRAARRTPAAGAARHARFHTAELDDPRERIAQARALLRFLRGAPGEQELALPARPSGMLARRTRAAARRARPGQRRGLLPRVRRPRRRATACSTSPRPTSSRCRSARLRSCRGGAAGRSRTWCAASSTWTSSRGRMFRQTLLCRAGRRSTARRARRCSRALRSPPAQTRDERARRRRLHRADGLDADDRPSARHRRAAARRTPGPRRSGCAISRPRDRRRTARCATRCCAATPPTSSRCTSIRRGRRPRRRAPAGHRLARHQAARARW